MLYKGEFLKRKSNYNLGRSFGIPFNNLWYISKKASAPNINPFPITLIGTIQELADSYVQSKLGEKGYRAPTEYEQAWIDYAKSVSQRDQIINIEENIEKVKNLEDSSEIYKEIEEKDNSDRTPIELESEELPELERYIFRLTGVPAEVAELPIWLPRTLSLREAKAWVQRMYRLSPEVSVNFIQRGTIISDSDKTIHELVAIIDTISVMSIQHGMGSEDIFKDMKLKP